MTNTLSKNFEKPGTYKFENVDGVKGSQTVAFVSGEVSGLNGLEDIYFKVQLNLDEKIITVQTVNKYMSTLEDYDIDEVLNALLNNMNNDTLFAGTSSGDGTVLFVHTPLKTQVESAKSSALGRAAIILAEIPASFGADIPELEVDDGDNLLDSDEILSLEA